MVHRCAILTFVVVVAALSVLPASRAETKMETKTVIAGDTNVALACVGGTQWILGGEPITGEDSASGLVINKAQGSYNLVITKVTFEQAGSYMCMNDVPDAAPLQITNLQVIEPLRSGVENCLVSPTTVIENGTAQLRCTLNYRGGKGPGLRWVYVVNPKAATGFEELNNTQRNNASRSSKIHSAVVTSDLKRVTGDMNGKAYQCRLSDNKYESARNCEVKLAVLFPPRNVVVTVSATKGVVKASVAVSANPAPDSFQWQLRQSNESVNAYKNVTTTAKPEHVFGQLQGLRYYVRCVVTNRINGAPHTAMSAEALYDSQSPQHLAANAAADLSSPVRAVVLFFFYSCVSCSFLFC